MHKRRDTHVLYFLLLYSARQPCIIWHLGEEISDRVRKKGSRLESWGQLERKKEHEEAKGNKKL